MSNHIHAIIELRHAPGTPVWQRNDYEHVIRAELDLEQVRACLRANPARWASDAYYAPSAPGR